MKCAVFFFLNYYFINSREVSSCASPLSRETDKDKAYVCVFVYDYVCVYVCTYAFEYVCVCVHMLCVWAFTLCGRGIVWASWLS